MSVRSEGKGTSKQSKQPKQPSRPGAPYLQWGIDTGFRYLRDGDWLPLLVQFRPDPRGQGNVGSLARFIRLKWLDPSFKRRVRVPDLVRRTVRTTTALRESQEFNFCVLWVRRDSAATITGHPTWRKKILRAELGPPIQLRASRAAAKTISGSGSARTVNIAPSAGTSLQQTSQALQGLPPRVAIGVIDQGIAFAHQRFRNIAGTRIEGILLQDASAGTGLELTKAQIDAVSASGHTDEMIYRKLGLLDFATSGFKAFAMRRTHGTHVLDLAAGADVADNVTDRPILAVEMPEDAVGEPVGSTLTTHAWMGILYILERANTIRAANETLPIVINLSYGPHDGPHDGSSVFEQSVDLIQLVWDGTKTPVRFVFAAGNSRQARVHASAVINPNDSIDWEWRVQPADQTPSFLQLWFDSDKAAVDLIPPDGRTLKVSRLSPKDDEPAVGPRYSMSFELPVAPSTKSLVSIFISPTATDPPLASGQPTVPAGLWTIRMRNRTATAIAVDGWVRRDETLTGRRSRGRQARFDDPAARQTTQGRPVEFGGATAPAYVDRRGTLSGIATGKETFVVGGYCIGTLQSEMRPASYSSAGPNSNPLRPTNSLTYSFPSEDSVACHGRLAAGTCSGSSVAMNGTSVAAPQATRWIADRRALTGAFPVPPLKNPPTVELVKPNKDPQRPIPLPDVPLVTGDGLIKVPMVGRPSRMAPLPN